MARIDGRANDETREIKITRDFILYPEGSVLIEMGKTKVICNATIEEGVPPFLKGSGTGWVTAEYSMLPRSTATRNSRDINKLKQNARSVEIQRLISRSLRAGIDLKLLGERTIIVDCDVIQADGGTRTASISGASVAMIDACKKLLTSGTITENPIKDIVSAISVGIVNDEILLDLCYEEDSAAQVDMNIVMSGGRFVEIQGTGEEHTFDYTQLNNMINYAVKGNNKVLEIQKSEIY